MASNSGILKTLGLGFPFCGIGVTVPTSTKPKLKLKEPFITSAFLSKPAANPIGLSKSLPRTLV